MNLLTFRREARMPPPEHELLTVDDAGIASAWRSSGAIVGRLGGPVADTDDLRAAVDAVRAVEPPRPGQLPPDASVETLEVAGRSMVVEARAEVPDGPWGALVERARAILDAQASRPVAAVTGVLSADGRLRLEHRGTQPIDLEMAAFGLELTRWRDGRETARGTAWERGPGLVHAEPGWGLEVPMPAIDPAGGGTLVAVAGFGARDDGQLVPVRLTVLAPAG